MIFIKKIFYNFVVIFNYTLYGKFDYYNRQKQIHSICSIYSVPWSIDGAKKQCASQENVTLNFNTDITSLPPQAHKVRLFLV